MADAIVIGAGRLYFGEKLIATCLGGKLDVPAFEQDLRKYVEADMRGTFTITINSPGGQLPLRNRKERKTWKLYMRGTLKKRKVLK